MVVPSLLEIWQKSIKALGCRPCLWQILVVEAILKHDKDVISIAATGSGKTLIFWLPLLFQDGIQIIITALNLLGKQQVEELAKLGLTGIALSAENATAANFQVRIASQLNFDDYTYPRELGYCGPEVPCCGDQY